MDAGRLHLFTSSTSKQRNKAAHPGFPILVLGRKPDQFVVPYHQVYGLNQQSEVRAYVHSTHLRERALVLVYVCMYVKCPVYKILSIAPSSWTRGIVWRWVGFVRQKVLPHRPDTDPPRIATLMFYMSATASCSSQRTEKHRIPTPQGFPIGSRALLWMAHISLLVLFAGEAGKSGLGFSRFIGKFKKKIKAREATHTCAGHYFDWRSCARIRSNPQRPHTQRTRTYCTLHHRLSQGASHSHDSGGSALNSKLIYMGGQRGEIRRIIFFRAAHAAAVPLPLAHTRVLSANRSHHYARYA